MKPTAIIYTSNTGYTAEYARLLGDKTGLPVYALADALKQLPKGSAVIYLGWLMASKVQGYSKAAGRYQIQAVCGVCMGPTGSQLQEVRSANRLPAGLPVFTLQGGFDLSKLRGVYKLMMTVMKNTAGKGLAEKENRTPEEDAMLELLLHGGSYVSEANLEAVLAWYGQE
ncbi:MAG: hypothetical protein ACI3VN_03430 [Candidatus Onthomonas sp.]